MIRKLAFSRTAADLLWASAGVNRSDGRRTAPSALNRQEVDVYLVTAKGAWRYDAEGHALEPAAEGNLLGFIAGTPARRQDFVDTAALSLLYVSDVSKLPGNGEMPRRFAAVDAGMAAQNALLYCAAAGLACVPRATMDSEALASALRLKDSQIPVLNIVVGPAKAP
ncbi:MAG: SagB/ThcOx family dehydrogenase [Sutterella sp.]|nr:SagB/ThcOx family dehydrogenase [Sutterella sp.]